MLSLPTLASRRAYHMEERRHTASLRLQMLYSRLGGLFETMAINIDRLSCFESCLSTS